MRRWKGVGDVLGCGRMYNAGISHCEISAPSFCLSFLSSANVNNGITSNALSPPELFGWIGRAAVVISSFISKLLSNRHRRYHGGPLF